MPIAKNRRAEAKARGLITSIQALVARASFHIIHDDPLAATRLLRTAEQLNALERILRTKRALDTKTFATARALEQRERACDEREQRLEAAEARLNQRWEAVRRTEASVAATYQLMRNAEIDGPPPAIEPETASGVAPL